MRQYLKAIIWPKGHFPKTSFPKTKRKPQGEPNYRYVLVGMLVTDEPIAGIEGVTHDGISQMVADGPVVGLAELLQQVEKRAPNLRVGDATDFLLSLSEV